MHVKYSLPTSIRVGEEERERFVSELESFIAHLLKMVEVELKFNYETLSKISSQVHGKDSIPWDTFYLRVSIDCECWVWQGRTS